MTHPTQPSLENWEAKLNELGFIHPPLHQLIKNLISQAKQQGAEEEREKIKKKMGEWWDGEGYWTCSANEAVEGTLAALDSLLTPQKEDNGTDK